MNEYTFQMTRNRTFMFAATILLSGNAVDITSGTLSFVAKHEPDSGAKVFTKTIGNGIAVVSAPAGTITVTIGAPDTSALPNIRQRLYYELIYTDAASLPWTVLRGELYVYPSID